MTARSPSSAAAAFTAAATTATAALVPRALRRHAARWGVRAGEAALAALGVPPPEALLVLGHMRSGSTLLLHLLLTTPEIAAIGERNAPYRTDDDLARLAVTTRVSRRLPLRRLRYVADQINHDRFGPDPALLAHPRVRLLFLVREPAPTVTSLLDLMRTHYEPWTTARAVDYYVERLAGLSAAGAGTPADRAAFLTYADLTTRTAETLPRLQAFLHTRHAFRAEYGAHDFTGRRGDPGPLIRTGRVTARPPRPMPPLPPAELARAQSAYDDCRRALAPLALLPPSTAGG